MLSIRTPLSRGVLTLLVVGLALTGGGLAGTTSLSGSTVHPGAPASVGPAARPLGSSLFEVNFSETGLPPTTPWGVTLDGSFLGSASPSVEFLMANGSYAFNVSSVPGFVANLVFGNLTVNGSVVFQNISFSPFAYPVTFTEAGLPGATSWGVTLNGTLYTSATAQIVIAEPNGTYSYSVQPVGGYLVAPASGGTDVAGARVGVNVTFTPVEFPVTFNETGVADVNWSVNLSGSVRTTNETNLTFQEPNGTYAFTVLPPAANYSTPASGSVTVNDGPAWKDLVFTSIPPLKYPLSFNETGLAPGTRWQVNLSIASASATGPTIVFLKANGTFHFNITPVVGYSVSPGTGVAVLSGPTTVDIIFTALVYPTNFTETGLPHNTNWSVQLGSSVGWSASTVVSFSAANGSYAYAVTPVTGFRASPSNGTVLVNGTAVDLTVDFTAIPYPVNWTETGLPSGTNWSVTVGGHTLYGTGARLVGANPNGTYPFTVGHVAGYDAIPSSGNVTVAGHPVSVSIAFSSTLFAVTFTAEGLTGSPAWTVTLAGVPSTGTSVNHTFNEPSGTYGFQVATVPGFTAAPASGNVTVAGAAVQRTITFTPLPPGTYPVTFLESGLGASSPWSVTLNSTEQGSSTSEVVFNEPNGSYDYAVGAVAGFTRAPTSGSVVVAGQWVNVSVTFTAVPPTEYPVSFNESGLAPSTNWTVQFNGRLISGTSSTLVAPAANGTFAFNVTTVPGYAAPIPSNGSVLVHGGPAGVSVTFTALPLPRFAVTFVETGLPAGTPWTVVINGSSNRSTDSDLSAGALPAGNYTFSVSASGYIPIPASGSVHVTNGPMTVNVSFQPTPISPPPSGHVAADVSTLVFLGAMGVIVALAVGIALATRSGRRNPP